MNANTINDNINEKKVKKKEKEIVELPNDFAKSLIRKIESYGNNVRSKLEAALTLTTLSTPSCL